MAFPSHAIVVTLVVFAAVPFLAGAGDPLIPKHKGAARTVGLFNFMCLKQLPDLQGIERAAGFGEFDQLTGADLAPYIPPTPTEKFLAWRYHDHGEEYVLTASRSKPDDAFKSEAPPFAAATNIACSLLVPDTQPLIDELTRVMGRAPDKTLIEGDKHRYAWTHQQANALSQVYYAEWTPHDGRAALGASIYLKK